MESILLYWLMIFGFGGILWLWERRTPLRKIEYNSEFFKELSTVSITVPYGIFGDLFLSAIIFNLFIFPANIIESTGFLSLPLWVRLLTAYLGRELTYYIIHRLQHSNMFFWLTHHWHHSSPSVWWLVAQRVSFTSMVLYRISFMWFPLLKIPPEIILIVMAHLAFQDNWIHLNVKWQPWMKIIEWIYVTPRFHSIHHYDMRGKNLGDTLTIFDRLFGTYLDPDTYDLKEDQSASNNEPITVRMVVGI
ncbi:MAG: sterol desaturase family protein [Nostoc sp. SerVER01]|nr:sterol desaturase family protein [Nostoc sp. SerVER01]